jgi:hypothetical protein
LRESNELERIMSSVLRAILWIGGTVLFVGIPIMSLPMIEHFQLRVRARRFAKAVAQGDLRAAERRARGFFDLL